MGKHCECSDNETETHIVEGIFPCHILNDANVTTRAMAFDSIAFVSEA